MQGPVPHFAVKAAGKVFLQRYIYTPLQEPVTYLADYLLNTGFMKICSYTDGFRLGCPLPDIN